MSRPTPEGCTLRCGRYALSLARPLVMGVVNITPDSFSDGGAYFSTGQAVAHARALVDEGADLIDIGGESTRPGAAPVPVDEELKRVIPVLDAIGSIGVPVSVDTSKPEVMRAALAHGADMINDIAGFRAPGALEEVAPSGAALCIMHMQGEPRTMQAAPHYADVVAEVRDFLQARAHAAREQGIADDRIVLDPGFGFGKSFEHNLRLLHDLRELAALGWPLLVGLSRKSMLGRITGREASERVHASIAAALLAVINGARIVRAHDVRATRDALAVFEALQRLGK